MFDFRALVFFVYVKHCFQFKGPGMLLPEDVC